MRRAAPEPGAALLLVVLAAIAMMLLGPLGVPAAPASAASNGQWSVYPTTAPGQQARPYFAPLMAPNSSYPDSVTVVNQTGKPLTFNLYPADGFNADNGGFSLRRQTDPQHDIGAWVHLEVSRLTVPANSGVEVPFTITPPANATPGYHVGGIVAENTTATVTHKGAVRLGIIQAVGTRIYARIIGPLRPGLAITAMSIQTAGSAGSPFGGSVTPTVTFRATNTGNVPLSPRATVHLSPLIGGGPTAVHEHLPQILPHGSATITVHFPSVVAFSYLSATATLTAPGAKAASGSTSTVIFPWALLLILLVVLAAVTFFWHRRRRARRLAAAAGPAAAGPAASGAPRVPVPTG